MLIKYPALAPTLKNKNFPIFIAVGSEPYLINDSAFQIKSKFLTLGDVDCKTISVESPADWSLVQEEANSYSLFAENVFITVYWNKKSLDKAAKSNISAYLSSTNPRCQILIIAPNIASKETKWLSNQKDILVVQAYPFSSSAMQSWVAHQLNARRFHFEPDVPHLIYQYTQGNMLACSQFIERLYLVFSPEEKLTTKNVEEHLFEQCEYQLFELSTACLTGNTKTVHQLLNHAQFTQQEPTLILWILTQEIRQLIRITNLTKKGISFANACQQLKIWSSKIRIYQQAHTRQSLTVLYQALQFSYRLDEQIKSNKIALVWQGLEKLAFTLCLGTKDYYFSALDENSIESL